MLAELEGMVYYPTLASVLTRCLTEGAHRRIQSSVERAVNVHSSFAEPETEAKKLALPAQVQ